MAMAACAGNRLSIWHFLATHGFVVVAMDHIYNTFRDLDREKFLEHVLQRPRDVRDTFDWLISKSLDPDHALSGCIQPNAGYAVMGHSSVIRVL